MSFQSTKIWGPISATFRQPGAHHSHCRWNHGYGLKFKAVFSCINLDTRDWVMDFGGLKQFKKHLEDEYDHKTILRHDDPAREEWLALERADACSITWRSTVGCEAFARQEGLWLQQWLNDQSWNTVSTVYERNRVDVFSMEVMEHENNSAIWFHDKGRIRDAG